MRASHHAGGEICFPEQKHNAHRTPAAHCRRCRRDLASAPVVPNRTESACVRPATMRRQLPDWTLRMK